MSADQLASISTQTQVVLNGKQQSVYLDYLPAIYRDDDFMGRFLLIFESIFGPIESMVDNLPLYFDPSLCPDALVPWLSSWVALVSDERLPLERRRRLIESAAVIYRWRGTKRGLKMYLQTAFGVEPLIVENTDGITLGADSRVGINARLGRRRDNCIRITMHLDDPAQLDVDLVKSIVESEKPAHVAYTLEITSRQVGAEPGGATNGV